MAFFDELKAGLSEVAKTVGEKSEQLVSVSKLHLKKTNLSNELKATYLELGKKVYAEKKAGSEFSEDIAQLCQKVDVSLEAIEEVEALIAEAKAAGKDVEVTETAEDEEDIFVEEVTEIHEEPTEKADTEGVTEEVAEEAAVCEAAEDTQEAE